MAVDPEERLSFLEKARKRFALSEERYTDWRKSAAEANSFIIGEQWDPQIQKFREADKRPCITVNRLAQMTRLVSNQIHRTKPAMRVLPVDSAADVATAEKIMGVIRHIERNSNSGYVYGNAVDGQVKTGLGFFGFQTRYSKRGSFDMDVGLRAFRNQSAVYPDAHAQQFDLSDATHYFVVEEFSKEAHLERYPDSDLVNADLSYNTGETSSWMGRETVRVAEYWYIETETETLYRLKNGSIGPVRILMRSRTRTSRHWSTRNGKRRHAPYTGPSSTATRFWRRMNGLGHGFRSYLSLARSPTSTASPSSRV